MSEPDHASGLICLMTAHNAHFSRNIPQGTKHFCILIIGNANIGKTTILEKVCHAQGLEPKFLDVDGKKVYDMGLEHGVNVTHTCSLWFRSTQS